MRFSGREARRRGRLHDGHEVSLADGVDPDDVSRSALWEVRDEIYRLAEDLDDNPPSEADDLARRARDLGCEDLVPTLT